MKLRVLFLKRVHILLFSFCFLFVLIVLLFYPKISNKNKAVESFYTINNGRLIKADFTGDGKKDLLYTNTDKGKYFLHIVSNKKIYSLTPNKSIKTFGYCYPYCPMSIYPLDVNNDNIKDLVLQSMDKGLAIQHIILWNGKKFIDTLSSYNNLIGIDYDEKGNQELISGYYSYGKLSLNPKNFNNGNFKKINMHNNLYSKQLSSFIKYIEDTKLKKNQNISDIISPNIDGECLNIIDELNNSSNKYNLTYGNFYNISTGKTSEPAYCCFLNFSITPTSNYNVPNDYMTLIVKFRKHENEFRVFSVEKGKLLPSNMLTIR